MDTGVRAFALAATGVDGLAVVRTGGLSYAQHRFWLWHEECPPGGRGLLTVLDTWNAAGAGVATVRAAIDTLLGRHEALRTTFGVGPDGRPVQRVRETPALVPVELRVLPRAPVERNVALVRAELGRREFALDTELPARFALVLDGDSDGDSDGDRVRAVVVALHHAVVDNHAVAVLRGEFRALVSGRPLPAGERRHPVDWAQEEASEAGRRRADRALATVAPAYARLPPRPGFPSAGETGFRVLRVVSGRAAADLRAVADRHAVAPSAVLVAAYLVALAEVSGGTRVATRVAYSNRHPEHAGRSVACLVQDVVVDHDVTPGTRYSAVLTAVARLCLTRYAAGRYPYERVREALAAVRTSINYIPPSPGAAPAGGETLDWIDVDDSPGFVHDLDLLVVDTAGALTFELNADTAAVPAASVEAIVATMRRFLAALADGGDPPVRLIPAQVPA